jgi:hypothetical protein
MCAQREAMVEAVRYCKENNSDLIIISGANEFFIEVILGVITTTPISLPSMPHRAPRASSVSRMRS